VYSTLHSRCTILAGVPMNQPLESGTVREIVILFWVGIIGLQAHELPVCAKDVLLRKRVYDRSRQTTQHQNAILLSSCHLLLPFKLPNIVPAVSHCMNISICYRNGFCRVMGPDLTCPRPPYTDSKTTAECSRYVAPLRILSRVETQPL
jgi:hypothetical protein